MTSDGCTDVAGNPASGVASANFKVDEHAPTITDLGPTTSPNGAGWYNHDVTNRFQASDSGSGLDSTCLAAFPEAGNKQSKTTTGEGTTVNVTSDGCTDVAGNPTAGKTSANFKVDETAPSIVPKSSLDSCSLPGNGGWCRGTQTAGFTASDATSGPSTPCAAAGGSSCDFTRSTGTNGSAVPVASGDVYDVAGNRATSVNAGPFKIDSVAPAVSVTGVSSGATYILGSVPAAGCTTTDTGGSGVATNASVNVTGGTPNHVGDFTATCSGAYDVAGNPQVASVMYHVNFTGLSGILQPINPDDTSVFSRGKAIPVKFQLAGDEYVGFNTSSWTIQEQQLPCSAFDGQDATLESTASNTPSTTFRYDPSADQYIYNADMHSKAVGTCWNFKVKVDSNQVFYSAVFKLQK